MTMAVWHGPARLPFWHPPAAAGTNIMRSVRRRLRLVSVRCLMIGHDDLLAREPHRLFLRCAECGRCTRGWVIGTNPPRVTAPIVRQRSLRSFDTRVRASSG
jgi:hypothetical protein